MASDKYAAQNKYAAKYKKQIKIDCFTSTEQDIIDRLNEVPNKAGYIKQLIRDDIKRHADETSQKKARPLLPESEAR